MVKLTDISFSVVRHDYFKAVTETMTAVLALLGVFINIGFHHRNVSEPRQNDNIVFFYEIILKRTLHL